MIKQLWAKNYRSLADITVDFEPLTVLVGHNGSGKSNIVDALWFVSDAVQIGLNNAILKRGGPYALYRWSTEEQPYDIEIGLTIDTDEWHGRYSFTLGSDSKNEYGIKQEICFIHDKVEKQEYRFEAKEGTWLERPHDLIPAIQKHALVLPLIAEVKPYKKLHDFLTAISFYNIDPNVLVQPQKPATPYPLARTGKNITSTLWEMEQAQSPRLKRLRHAIRSVIPDVVDFQVHKTGGYRVLQLIHDMRQQGLATFDLIQESDGTLRLFGILVTLYQDNLPVLSVLEEPELYIHPGTLGPLWDQIDIAAERGQFLITTHSPDLLDFCLADQIRVVEKVNGITVVDHLETAQKKAIQARLFAPGELFRAQGLYRVEQLPLS